MRTSLLRPYLYLYSQQSLTLLGEATCWEDLRNPAASAGPGATNPVYAQFRRNAGNTSAGVYAQRFADPGAGAEGMDLMFDVQHSHAMKTGSIISPHIHWSPNDANAGDVGWGIEYTEANIYGVFPVTTSELVAVAASGVQYSHDLAEFSDIVNANRTISGMMKFRVYRSDVGNIDTYAAVVWLHEFDVHYEIDTIGSRQEYIK